MVLGDEPVRGNRKRSLRLDFDRDRLMIRDADVLIAVHQRNTGGHIATLTALTRQLGGAVITMDPAARTVAIAKN